MHNGTNLTFIWVPGHNDIEENEMSDKAEKEAQNITCTNNCLRSQHTQTSNSKSILQSKKNGNTAGY